MAQTDLELLTQCAEFTLRHTSHAEQETLKQLETNSATPLVMALRIFNLQRAILAIGMFSLFESLLQSKLGWEKPFEHLDPYVRFHFKRELATSIEDYRLAINVLKHGEGPSYAKLLGRASTLEFKIREVQDGFFEEGNVSEVDTLIEVDDKFVRRCAELIDGVRALIGSTEQIWL